MGQNLQAYMPHNLQTRTADVRTRSQSVETCRQSVQTQG